METNVDLHANHYGESVVVEQYRDEKEETIVQPFDSSSPVPMFAQRIPTSSLLEQPKQDYFGQEVVEVKKQKNSIFGSKKVKPALRGES